MLSVGLLLVLVITINAVGDSIDESRKEVERIEEIDDVELQFAVLMTLANTVSDRRLASELRKLAQDLKLASNLDEIEQQKQRIEAEKAAAWAKFVTSVGTAVAGVAGSVMGGIPRLGGGSPEDEDSPRILVEELEIIDRGSGNSARYEATLMLKNVGTASYDGPYIFSAGLAYNRSWVPESYTVFDSHGGHIELVPGEEVALTFPIEEVPPFLYYAFQLYIAITWTGYDDTDPSDYVGFVLNLNADGFPRVVGYEEIQ